MDNPKVLLVDDEQDIRLGLRKLVGQLGAQVSVAADGVEALELVQNVAPDSVFGEGEDEEGRGQAGAKVSHLTDLLSQARGAATGGVQDLLGPQLGLSQQDLGLAHRRLAQLLRHRLGADEGLAQNLLALEFAQLLDH